MFGITALCNLMINDAFLLVQYWYIYGYTIGRSIYFWSKKIWTESLIFVNNKEYQ